MKRVIISCLGAWLAVGSATTVGAEPMRWQGIFPTVATPFHAKDGSLDESALEAQLAYLLRHNVDGIVVLDRHGEGPYLNWDERELVLLAARRMAFPRVPIIVGIEADRQEVAIQQMAQARQHGAAAVLIRYLGSYPLEAERFFRALSETKVVPIIYDHDRHTLPARTVGHILSLPGVIGLREAQLDMPETLVHLKGCQALGKVCFAGTTRELTGFLNAGGHGLMCPEATLLPTDLSFVYRASRHGRGQEACALCTEVEQVGFVVNAQSPAGSAMSRAVQRILPVGGGNEMAEMEMPAAVKYGLTCAGLPMSEFTRCPEVVIEKPRRQFLAGLRRNRGQVAPVPYVSSNNKQNWGCFLRTGGFQLAPGVSHDLLRSQGDGLWGFPIGN